MRNYNAHCWTRRSRGHCLLKRRMGSSERGREGSIQSWIKGLDCRTTSKNNEINFVGAIWWNTLEHDINLQSGILKYKIPLRRHRFSFLADKVYKLNFNLLRLNKYSVLSSRNSCPNTLILDTWQGQSLELRLPTQTALVKAQQLLMTASYQN